MIFPREDQEFLYMIQELDASVAPLEKYLMPPAAAGLSPVLGGGFFFVFFRRFRRPTQAGPRALQPQGKTVQWKKRKALRPLSVPAAGRRARGGEKR